VAQRAWAVGYAWVRRLCSRGGVPGLEPVLKLEREHQGWSRRLSGLASVVALGLLALGAWRLFGFFRQVGGQRWLGVLGEAGLTFGRILAACLLSAIWAIPLGVKIGLNPRLAKVMQPIIQVINSYPAPMLFPALLVVFYAVGLNFEVSSVLLMMIGTFAYLLFNVIGGASLIPAEQSEAWAAYGPKGWTYWRRFMLPAILPSLVVGMNTMMGAAWNATIVTEYIQLNGQAQVVKHGLGATINLATASGDLALLTAAVFVMAALVVALNRTIWLPLSDYAARLSQ
jgi:NitT/TauT family transport system permease protein